MSKIRQCPSTVGSERISDERSPRLYSAATGKRYWRGLDELADTPEFRESLAREFPVMASQLQSDSRRTVLKLMGASLLLAGVGTVPGCRRPDHKILPYTRDPEDVIHGRALYYATAMPLPGGGAEGLLAETHVGRPTKLEGNPLHSFNQGSSSVMSQASVLNLYDPDRLVGPSRKTADGRETATWDEFESFVTKNFSKFNARKGQRAKGKGLVFLVDKASSPTREAMRDRVLAKWSNAKWLPYDPVDRESAMEGARLAFGAPYREMIAIERAKVVLSIDRDFLSGSADEGGLPLSRGFAAGRRVRDHEGPTSEMNRLYAVESMITLTSGAADHRMRMAPSRIGAFFAAIASAAMAKLGGGANVASLRSALASVSGPKEDFDQTWIDAVADDLVAHRGKGAVVVGNAQPAAAHALAHALNAALSNTGGAAPISYLPVAGDMAASSLDSIKTLARDIKSKAVDTLIVIGANPVYDAPADLDFPSLYAGVPTTIHLGVHEDETAAASTWRLNQTHYLETWSDAQAGDGALSVVQPMIQPLAYEVNNEEPGRSDLELLATLIKDDEKDPYEIVRRTWREGPLATAPDFEKAWRRTLHDGVLAGSDRSAASAAKQPSVRHADVAQAVASLKAGAVQGVEVVFRPSPNLRDGRFANNGWLQELPHPVTKVTWDNPLLLSATTARKLNVVDGDHVTLTLGGRSITMPVWRAPGMADDTAVLELGYGRTHCGRVGDGVGFDTFQMRTSATMRQATGAVLERAKGSSKISCTQTHWAMEGRPLLQEVDLDAWKEHGGDTLVEKDEYGRTKRLTFGNRLGYQSHSPAGDSLYKGVITDQKIEYKTSPQWGMSIDLATCSGCGACTIACQAENNIPVVGKAEVRKGREMHWIRVDRYFSSVDPEQSDEFKGDFGDAGPYTGGREDDNVDMGVQPVPCMQCENAPCETVCPVNATVHDKEGLNVMAYNRCIGTRYCSNNCPYKVRRFNYFDYATKRLDGHYKGEELIDGVVTNRDMIPPRLREKTDEGKGELQIMQNNPDVTVRERGIMEKCTYCIQRINEARIESKLEDLTSIPDGFFQTACQQACPSNAIVFGDIMDPLSKVRALRDNTRSYSMLDYLNVRPRTTYMVRLRNPNPRLRTPIVDPFGHEAGGHESGSEVGLLDRFDDGRLLSLKVLNASSMAGGLA